MVYKMLETYSPIFMLDEKEPFAIKAIGCTIFTKTKRSDSFPKREICVDADTKCVIEYAIWFDYDIQHLYELEHVWVYVGNDMRVRKVEGSFHGKYLNVEDLDTQKPNLVNATHPLVYLQPGKHAVLADARLVRLVPEWKESCMEKAGEDGVACHEMFSGKIPKVEDALQEKVRQYIKETYSFEPSLVFKPFTPTRDLFMSWEELKQSIPQRIMTQLEYIKQQR